MPDKPLEYAANLFKRGTEMAKQQARTLTLQTQIMRLRGERERLFLRMGQKVYALFEQELVKNADLLALCHEAREMEREIAEREAEIEQLRLGREDVESDAGASSAATVPTSPPASEGMDLGDAFLRAGAPSAPTTWASPPAAEAAEATPGADPTAEPAFLAEIAPAPVEPAPDGDSTVEPSTPAEPPAAEAAPGSDPAAEPPIPSDVSDEPPPPTSR